MAAAARPPPPRPAAASAGPPVSGGAPRRDPKQGSISLGTKQLFQKDMWIWAPDPAECFVPVKVVDQKGAQWRARDQKGKDYLLNGNEEICLESSLTGMADMINLEQLNEGAILHTIRTRFKKDQIYTYISTILMAMNPYQKFDIYGPKQRAEYQKRTETAPHAYALADNAYRGMRENQKSQSVVISGESGAGKTETTKIVLQYISFLSQEGGRHTIAKNTQNIEARILDCNPLMEAFGNAKTLRNNNSSRFGKYVQVLFDGSYAIIGASISSYLLEKTRVVTQAKDERNYHIFYQLLAGLKPEDKKQYRLDGANQYRYCTSGVNETTPKDVAADLVEWADTRKAMDTLAFGREEIDQIFTILAGLLHFGNVAIESLNAAVNKGALCKIAAASKAAYDNVCYLLKLDPDRLQNALMFRQIANPSSKRGSTLASPNTKEFVEAARDAVVKHIYGRLFNWLIARINRSLSTDETPKYTIGVLDIFGFERFPINRFEQLCINYCNEKLQQHYQQNVFRLENKVFEAEGIVVSADVEFKDNAPCLELIEARGGVFATMEDSLKARITDTKVDVDMKYLGELIQSAKNQKKSPYFAENKFEKREFIVKHYAGDVSYRVDGFVEKSRDTLQPEMGSLLMASKAPLLCELFGGEAKVSAVAGFAREAKAAESNKLSVGQQFINQLTELKGMLEQTEPHFIRCLKPNAQKKPVIMESALVMEQLRYSGIAAVINVRQQGFPVRDNWRAFFERYYIIDKRQRKDFWPPLDELQDASVKLLAVIKDINPDLGDLVQIGKSKVFMRAAGKTALEKMRNDRIGKSLSVIKGIFKGKRWRKFLPKLKVFAGEMRAALAARDPAKVTIVMKSAANVRLGAWKVENLWIYRGGQAAIDQWAREDACRKELKTAIDLKKPNMLYTALATATKIKMPMSEQVYVQALKWKRDIDDTIAEINQGLAARKQSGLSEAAAKDIDQRLMQSLGKAVELGLDESKEIKEAKSALRRLHANEVMSVLKAAIASRDVNQLTVALQRAKALQLDNEPDAVQAQQMRDQIENEQKVIADLTAALQGKDANHLKECLAKAETVLPPNAEIIKNAKAQLKQVEVRQALSNAVNSRSVKALDAAIAAAKPVLPAGDADLQEAVSWAARIRDVEKQLSDARASKDLGKLLAAIKMAQEANYTSDTVKAATKEHEAMSAAINDAKSGLRRAVANKRLPEIATAIAKATSVNLPKGDIDFVEANNWQDQLTQLEKTLENAVKDNDMEDLTAAVGSAKEFGYNSMRVKEATDALTKLNFQKETREQCKAAITAKDAKLLDEALVKGDTCIQKCKESLLPETKKIIEEARALRKFIFEQNSVKVKLDKAMAAKDLKTVGDLLAFAAANNVDEGETAAARKWFTEIDGARNALRDALDSKDLTRIEASVPKLNAVLPGDPMIAEAKSVVGEVRTALDKLNASVKVLNVFVIEEAIETAKKAGLPDSMLADARAWLSRLKDLEEFIEEALTGTDLAEIGAAVKAAAKINYSSDNVLKAKALEKRLTREKEVADALSDAIRGRALPALTAALDASVQCEKEAPEGKVGAELSALVVEAKRIKTFLGEQSKLASELINALEFKQYAEVKRLVGKAAELKLDEGELKKAQKWLQEVDTAKGLVEQAMSLNELKALDDSIVKAEELGLRLDEVITKAKKQLNVLKDAKSELRNAVGTRSIPEIKDAIKKAQGLGLAKSDEDFSDAVKWDVKLTGLENTLDECIKGQNLDKLTSALTQAKELSFVSQKVKDAESLQSRLVLQKEVREQLRSAAKSRDATMLDDALRAAQGVASKCEGDGGLNADTKAAVAEATAVRQLLSNQSSLKDQLTRAVELRDGKLVASLLDKATEFKVADADTAPARKWLSNVDTARNALRDACKELNISAIQAGIARTGPLVQKGDEQLTAAEKLLTDLNSIIGQLNSAYSARSQKAVAPILRKASDLNLDSVPDVARAKTWLQAVVALKQRLSLASDSKDTRELEKIVADALHPDLELSADDDIVAAKNLLSSLRDLKTKLRAATEQRSLAALDTAILAASRGGLLADSDLAAADELRSRLKQIEVALDQAADMRDIAKVRVALQQASEAKFSSEAVKRCEDAVQQLEKQKMLVQKLGDAIVNKDVKAIEAAMELVSECGSLTAEAAAKVSQAQSAKKLITAQFMLRGDLNKAYESKDQKTVAALLSRANELNLDKAEAAKAQEWLNKVDAMKKNLITAVNLSNIRKIEEVLSKESIPLGVKSDPDVVHAFSQLEKFKKTISNLRDQVTKRELSGIEFAVGQAIRQGLNMDATVIEAQFWLGKLKGIERDLQDAAKRKDHIKLEQVLKSAGEARYKGDLYNNSKKLLEQLVVHKDAVKRLTQAIKDKDLTALADAIAKGTTCLEVAPGALEDTPKLLEDAKRLQKLVSSQNVVKQALTKAYASKDVKAISEIEKQAKELKLDQEPGEMMTILQWHDKVVKAKQKLAVAKQQRNTKDLEDSQKSLMELGLVDDEELVGSKSITTHLKALDNALGLKDPTVILQVLGHAKKAGLEDQPKYRTCEKLVQLIQATNDKRPHELDALLKSPELAELKTGEMFQTAQKYRDDVDKELKRVAAAMATKDLDDLERAIPRAIELGLEFHDAVVPANVLRKQLAVVEQDLKAAVKMEDPIRLQSALKRATELKYESAMSRDAAYLVDKQHREATEAHAMAAVMAATPSAGTAAPVRQASQLRAVVERARGSTTMGGKSSTEFMTLQTELKKIEASESALAAAVAKEKITSVQELEQLVKSAEQLNYTAEKLVEARDLMKKLTTVETDLNDKFIASKDAKGDPVAERDLDDLNRLLKQAEELKFVSPLVEKAKKQRAKYADIDSSLREAVENKDVRKVEESLDEAEKEKLKCKGVEKAKKFKKKVERVEKSLEQAKASGKLEDISRALSDAKAAGLSEENSAAFKDTQTAEKEITEKCRVCNQQCTLM